MHDILERSGPSNGPILTVGCPLYSSKSKTREIEASPKSRVPKNIFQKSDRFFFIFLGSYYVRTGFPAIFMRIALQKCATDKLLLKTWLQNPIFWVALHIEILDTETNNIICILKCGNETLLNDLETVFMSHERKSGCSGAPQAEKNRVFECILKKNSRRHRSVPPRCDAKWTFNCGCP